jgi:proteic killer suppression protein
MPGFDFHMLKGFDPPRCTIDGNDPWCITFEFAADDVRKVNLEQYQ